MAIFQIKREAYAAIEARFACEHKERELRLRVIKDGRKAFYRQCVRCGNAGRAISKAEAERELNSTQASPFDDELESKWHARKHATYVATYHAIKPRMEAEYRRYLESPEWSAKRAATFQRAYGICECCESFPATQAHHLTYERIGHEELSDLMAVCAFCHGVIHGKLAL